MVEPTPTPSEPGEPEYEGRAAYLALVQHYMDRIRIIYDEDASLKPDGARALSNACAQFCGDLISQEAPPDALIHATYLCSTVVVGAAVGIDTPDETLVRADQVGRFIELARREGATKREFLQSLSLLWDNWNKPPA